MHWQEAQQIMGKNFIGPDELTSVAADLHIAPQCSAPPVPFSVPMLKKVAREYILVLGVSHGEDTNPLTLNALRSYFGIDPTVNEPCFYNQDWYVRERFAEKTTLKKKWYLIRKEVVRESRGLRPEVLEKKLKKAEQFPTAILTAFTFFAYYFLHDGHQLWKHDFIWCSDMDKNGDRIYTGRYTDPKKLNKNGFNVHRHLSIRPSYGAVTIWS